MCQDDFLHLDDYTLLQALMHLPSLEVCRVCNVCHHWNRVLENHEHIFKFWSQLGVNYPMGVLAQGALWLNTVAVLSKICEVWKQIRRCTLLGASWLNPDGIETLVEVLQRNERPWHATWGSCEGTLLIQPWSFGSFKRWSHPAASLGNYLQLADLFQTNGKCLAQIGSEPLTLFAGDASFDVKLMLSFFSADEVMLSWSTVWSVDPLEQDIELELSGCLVSPCHAEIRPFGILGHGTTNFMLDQACYNRVLQSLHCKEDLVCVLRIVFRRQCVEDKVSAVPI